ncbi:inositol 1,4,5-triphosphate receptor associated 1 isoform X4 [Mustela nigripes]|uniref:inositol 1,4,5-triphosphate receptor associated 1 isoform X4 n=1 Tax=Mustela nigripes TaxID=77151 RepID=UPI002815D5C0|nr:inositol 1,4,5-triphosphate receptor associated 1 isoform X4 [Mustela nigripes]
MVKAPQSEERLARGGKGNNSVLACGAQASWSILGLTPWRFRAHAATPARRLPCPTFPRTRSPLESHRQPRAPPANSSSGYCSTVCHQDPQHDPRFSCFPPGPLEGPSLSAAFWPPTRGQKGPHTAGISCSPPTIILTGDASSPEGETDKNFVNRAHSPHRRLSHRHLKVSTASLTSVDPAGHVIDLVNDQLPDISISEEDKKKNLALLEEAKLVSERFLTRRGRKSRSGPGDSLSGLDACSDPQSPLPGAPPQQKGDEAEVSSPHFGEPNVSKGLADRKQNDQRKVSQGRLTPRCPTVEKSKETAIDQKENCDPLQCPEATPKGPASGIGSGGKMALNSPQPGPAENELGKALLKTAKEGNPLPRGPAQGSGGVAPLSPQGKGTAGEPTGSKFGSKAELRPPASRPPLQRGVSWDSGPEESGPRLQKVLAKLPLAEEEKRFSGKVGSKLAKAPGLKDFQIQVQPVRMQKLSKLREEHILIRNQNLVGLKLPELSEAAEQEKGLPSELSSAIEEEEPKTGLDVMPNISDMLLRKLRVHRSLPGSAPPLTEKEVENVFVQLSLAFRNDSYTLESRINQAERERNLTEENTEKELENFKASITSSASLWHHCEHRETYQKLLEDIAVLHRLAARLSSRAEMVGAVRQEKRMSKATEVMMQYVENLKRTYEKDHAELMEFKKLANQNSSRSCGPSEDGVPRTARSMSLTLGKNMPRRRVSVAVVPKFNALNIASQTPSSSPIPSLPTMSESPNGKGNLPVTSALPALLENGKTNGDPDSEASAPMPTLSCLEEISQETKARMEEEAYNKGYQEGLKKTQELQDLKEEEEQKGESPEEAEEAEETEEEEKDQRSSKLEELVHFLQVMYPKLCQHWQVIWMMATVMLVLTVVLGLYNSYNSCVEQADGPLGRSTCSAAQRDSWWSSGLQHEQPAEQ